MATTQTIGGSGTLFVGEDKSIRLGPVLNRAGIPVDMTGWNIEFVVSASDSSTEPILTRTATVIGVFNPDPLANTQEAEVVLTDDDLNLFRGSNILTGAKTYRHSWKRQTPNSETVLARGKFAPEKATAL